MYIITDVSFASCGADDDALYEVGAEVTYDPCDRYQGPTHEVGEPDISAPNCSLKLSRLVDTSTLPDGWSEVVELALIEAHEGAIGDMLDSAADYAYDCMREED